MQKFFSTRFVFLTKYTLLGLGFFSVLSSCALEREVVRPKLSYSLDDPVYYALVGYRLYNQEKYEEAIFQYEKLIKRFSPESVKYSKELSWAEYDIGFNYLVLGDYDTALKHFNRVIENYDNPEVKSLSRDRITEINAIQSF